MSISEDGSTPIDPVAPGSRSTRVGNRIKALARRGARTVGLVLLVIVAFIWVRAMASPYGHLRIDAGVMFAMGLVAAGVLLLRGQQPVDEEAGGTVAPPRPRSPLGVLTLSVVFLVVGTMILVGNLGVADVTMGHMAAAGLFVVGLGLLIGAWWGRSRFLILAGVVMIPFVIAGGFMHFPLKGSVGDQWVHATSIDDVAPSYELLAGAMYMELVDLEDFEGRREIDVSIAAGKVTILVPRRISLTINGHIEFGRAAIGAGRRSGEDLVLANDVEGTPGAGHLVINLRGGIASVYVERISFAQRHGLTRGELERREERQAERRREERKEDAQIRLNEERKRRKRAEARD